MNDIKEKLNDIICQSNSDYEELNEVYNYIEKIEKENQQLKEQLQQRDEVIDEAIDVLNKMLTIGYTDEKHLTSYFPVSKGEFGCRAKVILDILKKYKKEGN